MEKIEHIVLSGGGIGGIVEYGAIKYLIKQNIISMSNIKSFMVHQLVVLWLYCFLLVYHSAMLMTIS